MYLTNGTSLSDDYILVCFIYYTLFGNVVLISKHLNVHLSVYLKDIGGEIISLVAKS